MSCALCEETRGIQKCHIISRKFDWIFERLKDDKESLNNNILYLCPNHHFYFDKGLLKKDEVQKVKDIVIERINIFFKIVSKLKEKDINKELFNNDFDKIVEHFVYRNKTIKELLIK